DFFWNRFRLTGGLSRLNCARAADIRAEVKLYAILGKRGIRRAPRYDQEHENQYEHSDPCCRDHRYTLVFPFLFLFAHKPPPGLVAMTTFASSAVAIPATYTRCSEGTSLSMWRTIEPLAPASRLFNSPSRVPRVTRLSLT